MTTEQPGQRRRSPAKENSAGIRYGTSGQTCAMLPPAQPLRNPAVSRVTKAEREHLAIACIENLHPVQNLCAIGMYVVMPGNAFE